MLASRFVVPTLVATLTLAAAACRQSAPLPSADRPLALLDRPTLAGDVFDPAALDGKVVVINFWSPG